MLNKSLYLHYLILSIILHQLSVSIIFAYIILILFADGAALVAKKVEYKDGKLTKIVKFDSDMAARGHFSSQGQ